MGVDSRLVVAAYQSAGGCTLVDEALLVSAGIGNGGNQTARRLGRIESGDATREVTVADGALVFVNDATAVVIGSHHSLDTQSLKQRASPYLGEQSVT